MSLAVRKHPDPSAKNRNPLARKGVDLYKGSSKRQGHTQEPVMPTADSVTFWIGHLKAGDAQALQPLWGR
jgi:hypothetical protein